MSLTSSPIVRHGGAIDVEDYGSDFVSLGRLTGCSNSVVFSVTLALMKFDAVWGGKAGVGGSDSSSRRVCARISRRLSFKPTKKIDNCQPAMQIQNAAARYTDQFATVP